MFVIRIPAVFRSAHRNIRQFGVPTFSFAFRHVCFLELLAPGFLAPVAAAAAAAAVAAAEAAAAAAAPAAAAAAAAWHTYKLRVRRHQVVHRHSQR